jgi:cellulose synthase/poly-beta-1,6-N-acetylglucosamine synthase-like glycosyltransferase
MRLVHFMEQPQNRRVAVAQTPYSAVPGTPNTMERVAGATTDIQHIIHQGFTGFDATYWVGANALLRRAALEEIAETSRERGFVVTKFIQDRTVIEDTESTVDLVRHGWRLYNYPERLAYSATPRDFGALVIQRRRWANGGLIILPKLLAYLSHGLHRLGTLPEAIMRVHYLTSLAGVSLAMVILLAHPFERGLRNYWLPLTALPYFFLYGRDLVRSGYSWADLPRVYALNLLLIPVNLGGVCRSLYQACTGRETPFVRTPKVAGRTAAPPFYVVAAAGIVMWCVAYMAVDLEKARWAHAIFLLFNAGFMVYAIARLVGLREAWEDVRSLSSATESYQGLSRPAVRSKVV